MTTPSYVRTNAATKHYGYNKPMLEELRNFMRGKDDNNVTVMIIDDKHLGSTKTVLRSGVVAPGRVITFNNEYHTYQDALECAKTSNIDVADIDVRHANEHFCLNIVKPKLIFTDSSYLYQITNVSEGRHVFCSHDTAGLNQHIQANMILLQRPSSLTFFYNRSSNRSRGSFRRHLLNHYDNMYGIAKNNGYKVKFAPGISPYRQSAGRMLMRPTCATFTKESA